MATRSSHGRNKKALAPRGILNEFDQAVAELIAVFQGTSNFSERSSKVATLIDRFLVASDQPLSYERGLFISTWRDAWTKKNFFHVIPEDFVAILARSDSGTDGIDEEMLGDVTEKLNRLRKSLVVFVMEGQKSNHNAMNCAKDLDDAARDYLSIRGFDLGAPARDIKERLIVNVETHTAILDGKQFDISDKAAQLLHAMLEVHPAPFHASKLAGDIRPSRVRDSLPPELRKIFKHKRYIGCWFESS